MEVKLRWRPVPSRLLWSSAVARSSGGGQLQLGDVAGNQQLGNRHIPRPRHIPATVVVASARTDAGRRTRWGAAVVRSGSALGERARPGSAILVVIVDAGLAEEDLWWPA
jgi:hypothetical protein